MYDRHCRRTMIFALCTHLISADSCRSAFLRRSREQKHLAHMRVAGITSALQAEGRLPNSLVAYVSHIDHKIRWPESFCNADFAECIANELLPWLRDGLGVGAPSEVVLAGLSLTGLSAAHAAIRYPDVFTGF